MQCRTAIQTRNRNYILLYSACLFIFVSFYENKNGVHCCVNHVTPTLHTICVFISNTL